MSIVDKKINKTARTRRKEMGNCHPGMLAEKGFT
ncbi:hypothetical protein CCACVL1_20636 [Corchorus capsularis]|uniref:Uncharacterized protein n=1 Tax=Corchorus capsularis TaxID=210143 RepID=A0A1R3HAA6_COCAP|nr:hypothetical protein CCACVL1_20636 [Corchorus capsularis]